MSVDPQSGGLGLSGFPSLRRLMQQRTSSGPARAAQEQCELCSAPLAEEHAHLVELAERRLVCACDACAILFSNQSSGKYRRVPRRIEFLSEFLLSDTTWQSLDLPIELAFFLHNTAMDRIVALYPSLGGAIEALVPRESWEALTKENPVLRKLEPDVEALLVNRVKEARECYRVGIDHCYQLVGLIRKSWRGFSGGKEVWDEIGRFFAHLRKRAS